MIRTQEGRRIDMAFDSWSEYVDWVAASHEGDPPVYTMHSRTNSDKFNGGASWDEALRLSRNGWPEGRALIEARTERFKDEVLKSMGEFKQAVMTHDVAGAIPDIGRFLAGEPESMMTWTDIDKPGRVVRVMLNQATSAAVGANAITNKGAAVCALVDLLEMAGQRVEVTVMDLFVKQWVRGGGDDWVGEARTLLKHADAPLQIDQLAFALAHAASYRRIGFAWAEHLPRTWRMGIGIADGDGGYGAVVDTTGDRGDIYIGAQAIYNIGGVEERVNLGDDASAQRWLINTLRRAGALEAE